MGVRRVSALALALSLMVSGCTADDSTGSTGTVTLPSPSAPPTLTPTTTSTLQTGPPAAPDDLTTGPGVTDTSITAAVLLGADPDAGLTDGIRLYQQSVNQSGGICGRSLEFVTETGDPEAAYRRRASTVLGFLLPSTAGFDTVASASDRSARASLTAQMAVTARIDRGRSGSAHPCRSTENSNGASPGVVSSQPVSSADSPQASPATSC